MGARHEKYIDAVLNQSQTTDPPRLELPTLTGNHSPELHAEILPNPRVF